MVNIRGKAILNLDRSSYYVQLYHSCQNAKNKALVTNDEESKGLLGMMACLEIVQDFFIKLGIKPHMRLWEISILLLKNGQS